jgi:hypothetical protein
MTLALCMICGLFALMAVFVVATQVQETVNPLLADDSALAGLSDLASETLDGHPITTPLPAGEWQLQTLSSLSDAESLLDCLERQGINERELVILGRASFAVRWR